MNRVLPPPSVAATNGMVGGPETPEQEFWRLCEEGRRPDLADFLGSHRVETTDSLQMLVRLDQRHRWQAGDRLAAEHYLFTYPQLAADTDLAFEVVYHEFLLLEEAGPTPSIDEFVRRFPEHAVRLRMQLDLHAALDTSGGPPDTFADPAAPQHTKRGSLPSVPGYEVLEMIGRGGMGVVYRARQLGLNRLVALKMVRAAECAEAEVLSRFRAEAEIAARLHHPQIVQIYDYGEHAGLPYLALELIEGGTLADRLTGKPWEPQNAAKLIQELARAVQFAHERGVIHRDLKPANVLISSEFRVQSSKLDSVAISERGTVNSTLDLKIADFGLAKVFRDNASMQTQSGALLGTPGYMAPEQAAGRVEQITPATDVYAVGAILYEMLTGRPPFLGATPIETLQQVLTSEPVSIRLVAPQLPRDLATICTKCLSREPERRYRSAGELAGDLTRFLADQPIRARPTSSLERGWRWCRRNPALAGALSAVAALLVCVATGSTWYSGQLAAQLQTIKQAQRAEREANHTGKIRLWDAYLAEITARNSSRRMGQRFAALEAVDRAAALLDEIGRTPERTLQLRNATIASLALPDLRRVRAWRSGPAEVVPFDCSLPADRYLFCDRTGEITVCRLSDGSELLKLRNLGPLVWALHSPDGQFVAVRGAERQAVWRITGPTAELLWQQPPAEQFAFAPDGRHAAVSDAQNGMRLVDITTGQTVRPLGHGAARSNFAFHAVSGRVAVCGPGSIQIISCETGRVLNELNPKSLGQAPIAWHPSGDYVADFTVGDGTIALWDVRSGQLAMSFENAGGNAPQNLDFAGGGSHLLSYSMWDRNLKLWDAATGAKLLEVPVFPYYVCDVSPAGKLTLFARTAEQAELWEFALPAECRTLATGLSGPASGWKNAQVSSDNRLLAVGREKGLELWDLQTQQRLAVWPAGVCLTAFDKSGQLLTFTRSGLHCWPRHEDLTPGAGSSANVRRALRFGPPQKLTGPLVPETAVADLAGEFFLFQQQNQWNLMNRSEAEHPIRFRADPDARMSAISDDRRYAAIANWNNPGTAIFDAATGRKLTDLPTGIHGNPLFSPDSRWLATTPDGVRVWSVQDWRPICDLRAQGTNPTGLSIAFSPDSRVLAIGQTDAPLRLADPVTGTDYAELAHPDLKRAKVVAFSPDQSQLVTMPIVAESPAFIWDLASIRLELGRRGLDWPADVFRERSNSTPRDDGAELTVTLDDGGLLVRQQALDTLRQAAAAAPAAKIVLYRRALEVDPACASAHNNLAWLLATGPNELRDAPQSLTHARRAAELDQENATYQNTLGVALYRNAEYTDAIAALERSLAVNREIAGAYDLLFLALCHHALGQRELARQFLNDATAWFANQKTKLSSTTLTELELLFAEATIIQR